MPKPLLIVITGDSKDAQKAVTAVEDALAEADEQAKKSAKTLARYATAAAAAGAAFIAVRSSIRAAIDFESAISDLSAITGATGKDLQFLSDKALEFGSTTTLSASEAAEAFKLVASAKPDLLANAEALSQVTKEAITLAEASGSTLPDAAKTLGSALNQFEADADQAGRFINVLAAGAQKGASEIADTAQALKVSGTVAKGAAVSFEATNAAIQTLSTVSIKGAEAGTALRNIILKLQTQADDKFNPAIVGLAQSLKNLQEAELTTTEMSKLFGLENISAASALVKNADKVHLLTGELTDTSTAYDQASTKTDNLEGDLKGLSSAAEGLAITFGKDLTPEIRELSKDATAAMQAMAPVAVATAQAILIAFKPVITIFKAVSTGMEAFQAGAEASDSKVRGVIQSVEAFNKILKPNAEILKEMGINVRDIDPRNVDAVTEAMFKLNQHSRENNVELEIRGKRLSQVIAKEKTIDELATKKEDEKSTLKAEVSEGVSPEEQKALDSKAAAKQKALDNELAAQATQHQRLREMAEAFQLSEEEREQLRFERENEQFNLDLETLIERGMIVDEAIATQNQVREDAEAIHAENLRLIQENAKSDEQILWESGWQGKLALASDGMSQIAAGLGKDSKALFSLNKGLALAQTAISLPSAVTQSFEKAGGYPWGIPPAAAMAAKGAAEIAKIKGTKFTGRAHDGLDNNPQEGTMLLRRSEMVLDPGTSKEVREAAKSAAGGGGGGVNIGELIMNFHTDMRDMSDDELDELVTTRIAASIGRVGESLVGFGFQREEAFA